MAIPSAFNLSHNTAFTCSEDGQRVVAYGGRRKHLFFRDVRIDERGIHRVEGRVVRGAGGSVSIDWTAPRLVLDGSRASGCVERRSRVGPDCEFDGKLSVTRWQGRTWLFARANVAECGGRHVQVTSSADGVSGWSRWQLLSFCGGSVPLGIGTSNLYFFAVRPMADGARLVAYFPAVFTRRLSSADATSGNPSLPSSSSSSSFSYPTASSTETLEGGIYASTSEDGVTWRRPQRILASDVLPEWRTADYPVDGEGPWASFASSTSLLVEQGVVMEHGRALLGCARPSKLCAYKLTLPVALTAPQSLHACGTANFGGGEGSDVASPGRSMHAKRPVPVLAPPCPPAVARIAIVMRGEAFRWGCSPPAIGHQFRAIRSHVALAERLEVHHDQQWLRRAKSSTPRDNGSCARFYVAVDDRTPCGASAVASLLAAFGPRLGGYRQLAAPPRDQGEGMQAALGVLLSALKSQGGVASLAHLVISRVDMTLLTPFAAPWACAEDNVCVASKCEEAAWQSYRCVSDLLFLAPQRVVASLVRSIGSSVGASRNRDGQCGCFDAHCPHRGFNRRQHGTGHDCFNVLTKTLGAADGGSGARFGGRSGGQQIAFAWPQVAHVVSAENPHYALPACADLDDSVTYARRACTFRGKIGSGPIGGYGMLAKLKARALPPPKWAAAPASFPAVRRKLATTHSDVLGAETAIHHGKASLGGGGGDTPRVAVCLSGQLRVMVRKGLHASLKKNLIAPLAADVFIHVDSADTRQWGVTKDADQGDYDEIVRVLRPVAAEHASYIPPASPLDQCKSRAGKIAVGDSDGAAATPARVCAARDCGSFSCGCYVAGCSHCAVGQYLPQHTHARRCLEMIEHHEVKTKRRYEIVARIRPDLNVTRQIPPYAVLSAMLLSSKRQAQPPTLCAVGGMSPLGESEPLASLPLTLDDKFALMSREVASVYMNATSAFSACQSRRANLLSCGDGSSGSDKRAIGKSLRSLKGRAERPKQGSQSAMGKFRMPAPSPYWATPQCVLKRHLIEHLPDIRMVDCLRKAGERPPLRLIRP